MTTTLAAADLSCWVDGGNWLDCIINPLATQIGEPLFGLIIASMVLVPMYYAGNGDMAAPAVVLMLLAGAMAATIPGSMQSVAITIMIIGMVAAMMSVANKYMLR